MRVLVATIVAALGHEVIAREIEVEDVGAVTARERPDVALVGLGASSDHALGLIERIVREAGPDSGSTPTRAQSRRGNTSLEATGSAVGAGPVSARTSRARADGSLIDASEGLTQDPISLTASRCRGGVPGRRRIAGLRQPLSSGGRYGAHRRPVPSGFGSTRGRVVSPYWRPDGRDPGLRTAISRNCRRSRPLVGDLRLRSARHRVSKPIQRHLRGEFSWPPAGGRRRSRGRRPAAPARLPPAVRIREG
jgi:hypothetical protein